MFAVVDFVLEKAKDGTTPCEIVHMSWLTPDMKHCFWPGNSQYSKAFKKGGKPGNTWRKWPVIVKSFSGKYIYRYTIPSTSFFGLLDQTRPANKSTEVPVGPTVFTSTIQSDTGQQSKTQDITTSSIAAVGTPSRTVSSWC
ncbi:unnamed protein product [Allacma fusca]|uniref:Uncharacterized protein n=1 Tax=Allacma fusca TaxID=39272 RepID=A0A8J2PK27_9HEXA|nr:unnamed protein product [Allacma fusca]